MRARAAQTAHVSAGKPAPCQVTDWTHPPVILLCADDAQTMDLRARLMAMGTEVYHGACDLQIEETPLILVPGQCRNTPDILDRLGDALQAFPDADVRFVTGTSGGPNHLADSAHFFDTASALLNAAGICFVSALQMREAS